MIFERTIEKELRSWLYRGKILIIYGARQVGKTTLLGRIADLNAPDILYLDAEDPTVRARLTHVGAEQLKALVTGKKILFIDEAQKVRDIGSTLKLFADHVKGTQVIATGSSSFDLANKVKEPLTGRAIEFHLFPLTVAELAQHERAVDLQASLKQRMIFGMYPDVAERGETGERILRMITSSYVYKDALMFERVRDSEVLDRLLRALALQIGSEVSFTELANIAGTNKITVQRYIRILEQAFIIFRLKPYFRNRRKELGKLRKIYFWDVGIRNALINNLNPLELRTDGGELWENFFISERLKHHANHGKTSLPFFWRTYTQQEIDLVEETGGKPEAFECKLKMPDRKHAPTQWQKLYPGAPYTIVTPDTAFPLLGVQ